MSNLIKKISSYTREKPSRPLTFFNYFKKIRFLPLGLVCCGLASTPASANLIVANQAEADLTVLRIRASHFLSQATFGPTWNQIDELAREMQSLGTTRALNRWITDQFNLSPTLMNAAVVQLVEDTGRNINQDLDVDTRGFQGPRLYRDYIVWDRKLTAPDQLRQRMSDALSQILVVGDTNILRNRRGWRGTSTYNDVLLNNAFGNYRNLLEEVVYSPAMGEWLDSAGNQRTTLNPITRQPRFPDENFAREFLQLFTVGVFRLNESGETLNSAGEPLTGPGDSPDELYDNETIQEFARVFTGLNYRQAPGRSSTFENRFLNFDQPMVMHNAFHSRGRKTLLDGVRTPGGAVNGDQDIRTAIDNAFNHSNCPPFICRLLIQRFTTSNPSTNYVNDVVQTFKGVNGGGRGNLRRVLRAILMHSEARNSLNINIRNLSGGRRAIDVSVSDPLHGKLKEPFMQLTAMLRGLNVRSIDSNVSGTFRFSNLTDSIGQFPLDANSVFNFYLPDHQPVGRIQRNNIVAPEFEIFTPSQAHNLINMFHFTFRRMGANANLRVFTPAFGNAGRASINVRPINNRLNDPQDLLNYLNILFCQGTMNRSSYRAYREEILNLSIDNEQKVTALLTALLSSPDFAVHN